MNQEKECDMSISELLGYLTMKKGKVIPLQARCGPEGGYKYSSTLP